MRVVGLDDGEILDTALVVACFMFVNRIALGLGVEFSNDELSGYRLWSGARRLAIQASSG